MPGYRSNEAALSSQLKELQAEIHDVRARLADVQVGLLDRERRERRIQLLSKPWQICWGILACVLAVGLSWVLSSSTARGRIEAQERAEAELRSAREEVARAKNRSSKTASSEGPHPDGDGKSARVERAFAHMRHLNANESAEAWEILAGMACIRNDTALYRRAQRAGAPHTGPIRAICTSMTEPTP